MSPRGDGVTMKALAEDHYEFRWREDGHCRRRRIQCTPKQATHYKAILMHDTGRTPHTEHTFDDLADDYLKWAVRQKAFPNKKIMVRFLREKFGASPLPAISLLAVEQYQTELMETGKQPATCNRYIAVLKHMFTKAEEWKWISETTAKEVHKAKLLKEHNSRLRYLSPEEYDRLLAACLRSRASSWLIPIITIAVNTGMRQGEIQALKWNQVDLPNGVVLLERTKNGNRREVPLNEAAKEAFRSLPHAIDGGKVFSTEAFNHHAFLRIVRLAGIRDFRFHDLRHTFASWLVMRGADIATVQSLLGHKTINMTMRYAHLAPNHRAAAVTLLDTPVRHMRQAFQG